MERPQQHVPVLLEETLEYLNVRLGGVIVDATLGLGGHSAAIARKLGGKGKLICFDRDAQAMELAKARLAAVCEELGDEAPEVRYVPRAFSEIAEEIAPASLDGLLADFGVSSLQLDEAQRGFSFRADGPLDMRMDPRSELTAQQVVNQADEEDLANLIYEFGEERRSRRIRVNDELGEIQSLLKSAGSLMKPRGRVVLISFHSLEDRLVKDAFKEAQKLGSFEVMTKKPVVASEQESLRNPRSRSAKMRAAEKV